MEKLIWFYYIHDAAGLVVGVTVFVALMAALQISINWEHFKERAWTYSEGVALGVGCTIATPIALALLPVIGMAIALALFSATGVGVTRLVRRLVPRKTIPVAVARVKED